MNNGGWWLLAVFAVILLWHISDRLDQMAPPAAHAADWIDRGEAYARGFLDADDGYLQNPYRGPFWAAKRGSIEEENASKQINHQK